MNATAPNSDQLSALKGDFLASLSHEIRTPLSGVIGMVDLLLETTLTGEQKEYLDDARLCAENLLGVLNSTLEFSALSADQVSVEEADFPLRAMLNNSVADFDSKAAAKGLRLSTLFAAEVPQVAYGDALRLQQIFGHIVGNAIKFTSQGGVAVEVSVADRDESGFTLNVNIRDTGIGIAQENLDKIFDSFRQLETGLARRYTGMGLGLAVTRKLVALLNGDVVVDSRLGQGTEFRISIPLMAAREQTAHPRIVSKIEPARILLVEDKLFAQTAATHFLRSIAHAVDTADSGSAALDAAAKARYGLILMDLGTPGMDGFDTATRIRNLPGYSGVPVVALTASDSHERRDLYLKNGFQGFLAMPAQASELLKTVRTLLTPSKGPGEQTRQITRIAV